MQRYGGATGVRDPGALEAALFRPQTGYYDDIVAEAAALFESLAINHPFVDGNKRAALSAAGMFLNANGQDLELGMDWVSQMENLAAGKLSRSELVHLFAIAMGKDIPVDS